MADAKNEYNCSQQDLYSILETAWANYDEHQATFAGLKGFYTPQYSTDAKAAIAAAKAIPDQQARGDAAETLRVELSKRAEICKKNFKMLKSYISSSYSDPAIQKSKLDAAGQKHYVRAVNNEWEAISSMNQSGINFIKTNLATLTAGNNMPAGFQTGFDAARADFNALYVEYKKAGQTGKQTSTKIEANNAIFRTGMAMMKDGQLLFDTDADLAALFTFQSLWDAINPTVAGIKGSVTKAADNLPLPKATITAQAEGEPTQTTTTDDAGNYSLHLAADTYTITIAAPGFASQTQTLTLDGGYKTLDFVLEAG